MQLLFAHFVTPFTNLKWTHIHECNFCMYLGYYYSKGTSFDTSWNIAWSDRLDGMNYMLCVEWDVNSC